MTGSSCNRTQLIGICRPKLPAPKSCDSLASGEGPSGIGILMVPMPSPGTELMGRRLPELPAPLPDRFVGDDDSTSEQQFFDIAVAGAEAHSTAGRHG